MTVWSDAYDILDRRGWCQEDSVDDDGKVCVSAAIVLAVVKNNPAELAYAEAYTEAVADMMFDQGGAIEEHLKKFADFVGSFVGVDKAVMRDVVRVYLWNDGDNTEENVKEALRELHEKEQNG